MLSCLQAYAVPRVFVGPENVPLCINIRLFPPT